MSIHIDQIRIHGFRGLLNLEISLEDTTVLMGMNNAGKTSVLKALQIALGNSQFITQDDFNVGAGQENPKIIIDVRIVPVDESGNRTSEFNEEWELLFKTDRIVLDDEQNSLVAFRTIATYDAMTANYRSRQYLLPEWPEFKIDTSTPWYEADMGSEKSFRFEEIPFFYVDAQRDILEDMKMRTSYLGRMISKIEYSKKDISAIEKQIKELNDRAVSSSSILTNIKETLKELDSALDSKGEAVEITPFAKKVRDLNKSVTIAYGGDQTSFPMEYHGMGTRSWSSLLTLKSFIDIRSKNAEQEHSPFFPILAIEEPEAHLHPNAQKKLFRQIHGIKGQKIISTHSPYIVAASDLGKLRNFYKSDSRVNCGVIVTEALNSEDIRKVQRHVINTKGEIFFSKAIVLSEGETEEQTLPIFAEKYFGHDVTEIGIDFVGVGGSGGYLPFMRIAEAFNIPWFIFSDGEDSTVKKLKKDLKGIFRKDIDDLAAVDNVVVLDSKHDFEKSLLAAGYKEEITSALEQLNGEGFVERQRSLNHGTPKKPRKTDKSCGTCNQPIYEGKLRDYNGDSGYIECLYDCMVQLKTRMGPAVGDQIVASGKGLPPKVITLFKKVRAAIGNGDSDDEH